MKKRFNIRQHCPEVESLMGGKMPFITRYGITLVVISIAIVVFLLLISGGSAQKLMKEMIEKTLEQIKLKII
jgi:hypothetical protein